ncbi:MAG: YciI family protein [Janthinobacterium lividum]
MGSPDRGPWRSTRRCRTRSARRSSRASRPSSPSSRDARLYQREAGRPLVTAGPYAEAEEHLAGFFLVDVESMERAQEVVTVSSGPGETVELRATTHVRRSEGAAQEALAPAAVQREADGLPDHPRGWWIRVASPRLVDQDLPDPARAAREVVVVVQEPAEALIAR